MGIALRGLSEIEDNTARYKKHKNDPKSRRERPLPDISKLFAPNALKNQSPTSKHSTL